jgi:hypothetical protein
LAASAPGNNVVGVSAGALESDALCSIAAGIAIEDHQK